MLDKQQMKRMFDAKRYEGYRFCREGRWYYIEDGKFIMPGSGRNPITIDFICALTEEELCEFEGNMDNRIAHVSDDYCCETAPIFILNHGREPEEGLYLVIGYKFRRTFTNKYIRRHIEKMEKPEDSVSDEKKA
jgi:hypothetical protein